MKKLGFREIYKLCPRSKIKKFSQNSDTKVGVLPTYSLLSLFLKCLSTGCSSSQENSGVGFTFQ